VCNCAYIHISINAYLFVGLAAANQGFMQTALQSRVQCLKEAVTLFSQAHACYFM
jgi:hypothetical protein